MNIIEGSYQELIAGAEYQDDPRLAGLERSVAARACIYGTVIDTLSDVVIEGSLFSGFEGTCVTDGVYLPTGENVVSGVLCALAGPEWTDHRGMTPDHYAFMKGQNKAPAIGVYDRRSYDYLGHRVEWKTKDGLSVPETCTDIFIWR